MATNPTNLYAVPSLPDLDPRTTRVIQDLAARVNYLTTELDKVRGLTMSASPGVDAARKENPIQGIVNIPYRDHGGQDGQIRVSKDGVISSYVNPVESPFPYTDLSVVGNVGGGTDLLHTFTLPANTLANDGDWIEFLYSGTFATNDNDKRIQILFDSQIVEDFGAFDFDSGVWVATGHYSRVNSTSVRVDYMAMYGTPLVINDSVFTSATQDIIFLPRNATITVSNLNTTSVVLNLNAIAVADNDIVQNKSILEYVKPRTVKLV